MSDVEADDAITVNTLQTRLSELQTLWQTAKRRESSVEVASSVDLLTTNELHADKTAVFTSCGDAGEEPEHNLAASDSPSLQPTKPASPPHRSPRPFHPRALSVEGATATTTAMPAPSATASRDSSTSLAIPFPPHTPPTPSNNSNNTPRARQKAARHASQSATPERASLESLTLPPLQTHGAPAVLTCPQCNARVVSFASRYCTQCGVQLSGA